MNKKTERFQNPACRIPFKIDSAHRLPVWWSLQSFDRKELYLNKMIMTVLPAVTADFEE